MRKLRPVLFIMLQSLVSIAQPIHIRDSLLTELKNFDASGYHKGVKGVSISDSAKANVLNELFRWYLDQNNDSARYYAQWSLSLSQQIGYQKGIGNGYDAIGLCYMYHRDAAEAITFFEKALAVRSKINDLDGVAILYNNLGLAYGDEGNYRECVNNHANAVKLRLELKDTVGLEASYAKRGGAYQRLGDFPNALNDFLSLIKIGGQAGDKEPVAAGYYNAGNIYDEMGNLPEALKNYTLSEKIYSELGDRPSMVRTYHGLGDIAYRQGDDSAALENYNLALDLCKKYTLDNYEMSYAYRDISKVYLRSKNFKQALENCLASLKISEKLNNSYMQAIAYNTMGDVYEQQGQLADALKCQTQSLALAKETDARDLKMGIYQSLATINARLRNYSDAYKDKILYEQEYDSVYNRENERKVTGLQLHYDFSRQQDSLQVAQLKKDAITQQQIQRQKAFIGLGIAGFILLSALLFFVYQNYSNQRKATAAVEKARKRAEQSEKFKERFLANMSHEIRTPMNAVLGMSNLALDTSLNEKQRSYIKGIKRASEDLLIILDDILDLSKMEAGKMQLEKLPFNLRAQVENAMDILRFKANEKGLHFSSVVAENVPAVVIGDRARLNQILINLLGNAIKFTADGSVTLNVTCKGPVADNVANIQFSIRDTGIGITPQQQSKIFESFVQGESDTSRKFGGTGLGLAITKTLVEMLRGNIEVKSEPGMGSEFIFTIPYLCGNEQDLNRAGENAKVDYSELSKLNILVAEDKELNQVVIKDTLENLLPGIRVEIAQNGKIAVEKLSQCNYDIVLMDVHMPEMDGYEATRYIRTVLKSDVPIVALTASVIRGDLDKCTAAGMNGYVAKPIKRKLLLDELQKQAASIFKGNREKYVNQSAI
jgi:signal transduction histidine kinase/CheY-like chemotaxis protein